MKNKRLFFVMLLHFALCTSFLKGKIVPSITIERTPIDIEVAREMAYAGWDDYWEKRWDVIEKYYENLSPNNIEASNIKIAYIMCQKEQKDPEAILKLQAIHQNAYKHVLSYDTDLAQFFNYPLIKAARLTSENSDYKRSLMSVYAACFHKERLVFNRYCFTRENGGYDLGLFAVYNKEYIQDSIYELVGQVADAPNEAEQDKLVEKNTQLFKEAYEFCKANYPEELKYFYELELENPECTAHMFFLRAIEATFKIYFLPVLPPQKNQEIAV